jgi:hypothetical protein
MISLQTLLPRVDDEQRISGLQRVMALEPAT